MLIPLQNADSAAKMNVDDATESEVNKLVNTSSRVSDEGLPMNTESKAPATLDNLPTVSIN